MTQPRAHNTVFRETGMALAALAIWMLCLLTPLHQAAGALREMAKAGVDISGAWSICITLAEGAADPDKSVPDCPAQGMAKTGLALGPAPVVIALVGDLVDHVDARPRSEQPHVPVHLSRIQPRAPPLTV
ncbi:MAG: hypothetical protein ACK5IB_05815 [Qingshengfaniella sp.]